MKISKYQDMIDYPFDALASSDPDLPIVLDTETAGYTEDSRFVIYFSYASSDDVDSGAGPITTRRGFDFFKAILDSPRPKICHAITRDMEFVERSGLEFGGKRGYCTLLGHALLDEYHPTHSLDDLERDIFHRRRPDYYELEAYRKGVKPNKKNLYIPQELMHRYAHQDATGTLQLWEWEKSRLIEQGLWDLYEVTMDAEIYGWYQMEKQGIEFDSEAAEESLERIIPVADLLKEEIHEAFGEKFLITSPQQLGKVLAKHLPLKKKTKSGNWCTDTNELKKFRYDHRVQMTIACLKLTRAASKIRNRIAEGKNRLMPQFSQILVTGRSSCSGVPLQQIPKRASRISIDDVGSPALVTACTNAYKSLRKMWITAKGSTLVTFDYDQAEYRAAAHYTGSERLLSLLRDPTADFHSIICELVFGEVTPVLRDITKFINFGLLYGMGLDGLAALIGPLTTEPAAVIMRRYEAKVPEMREFQRTVLAVYKQRGYVKDVFGRRYRQLPDWFKRLHETDDYAVINYLCQGTVANIKRYAIARLGKMFHSMRLEGRRSKMIVEIHDELGFEIYPEDADVIPKIHALMTDFPQFSLPFTTAPNVGSNLLEVKEMTIDEAVEACRVGTYARA